MKNLILLAAVSLLFMGCGDEKKGAPATAQQMPPLSVKAHVVSLERADFTKSYPALIMPFKEVDVIARVSGVLVKENFIEGAFVKEGDTLYEIEKDEYEAKLNEAKAALLKAEANNNKASKDWSRAEHLFKNSAISEQQRDELLYAYDDSKAEVQKAKASLANAQIEYGYTTIKAPIGGVVGLGSSDEGSYIDKETSASKLTTITSLDTVYAQFSIPSSDILKYGSQIKSGAAVEILLGSKKYGGVVDFVSPKIDAQTDTLLLRAKFDNRTRELTIGSYAEVALGGLSYENVAKIPEISLVKTPEAIMVYVIEDGAVSMRAVKILHVDNGVAVIESGLKEGEQIVVSNMAKLRPNSKVSIASGE